MLWSSFFESFKQAFSLSSFTHIKRLFSFFSLSATRVISSTYLRLLIFLPAILIPGCDSSSPKFHVMYSAYVLNEQNDNIKPCRNPDSILNQSTASCLVLTIASWPAYRFLRIQVRWPDILTSLRILHRLFWSTQSKPLAQSMKQMFFWNSLAFSMLQQMLAIWSVIPVPFLNQACTSGSSLFTCSWSLAEGCWALPCYHMKWVWLYDS